MRCPYCEDGKRFETKKFPYETRIYGNLIIVSKRLPKLLVPLNRKFHWFWHLDKNGKAQFDEYRSLYSNEINYCPMCGKEVPNKEWETFFDK